MADSKVFYIENTDGTLTFALPPGALNGPGGVQRNTDLRLYGLGSMMWGEGVDENFLRLLENFACPAKTNGDYNPVSSLFDFDPSTQGTVPKDEKDLGFGKGITKPVSGQTWFNTTNDTMYYYDGVSWTPVGSGFAVGDTPPPGPEIGDLWYDTITPQLKIWDGFNWISVANRYVLKSGDIMTGLLQLSGNPTADMHAATKQYVDTTTVSLVGDTMTGFLTLHAHPTAAMHAATKSYVDTVAAGAGAGTFVLKAGDTMTGFLTLNADPTANMHAATKKYVDDVVSGANTPGRLHDIITVTVAGSVFSTVNVTTTVRNSTRAYVQVFVNGVLQREGGNFNCTGTKQLTFTPALVVGDEIVVFAL